MNLKANPRSTIQIAGHPIHVMLVPFVIAFYVGTLAADFAYSGTGDPFWARGAFWLLTAGVAMSLLAATAGFLDFVLEPKIRALSAAWWHFGGNALMSLISLVDLYLRYRAGDEAGSHAYWGLALAAVLLLLFNGWKGWEMVYRHHVGVSD
ncbi:MAG TPA: DUF2231 domain-containing protein [Rhizomicrobium sp.]|jgi:uncharacterized membrane protein